MELQQLENEFAVCKLASASTVDLSRAYTFLSVTDDEISLVCDAACVPDNATQVQRGWVALKIRGILDFGMIGVIAGISALLAGERIGIFVVSTYNTDYVLFQKEHCDAAVAVLRGNGYVIS